MCKYIEQYLFLIQKYLKKQIENQLSRIEIHCTMNSNLEGDTMINMGQQHSEHFSWKMCFAINYNERFLKNDDRRYPHVVNGILYKNGW